MSSIKIRSKSEGNSVLIRVLIQHPMETGRRQDEVTGALIAAHFIQSIRIEHNNVAVMNGQLTTGVSKNPYVSIRLKNAKAGDHIKVQWHDNLGQSDSENMILGETN